MRSLVGWLAVVVVLAVVAGVRAEEKETRVYELRIYTTHPGRLDALNARFRDHTCKLFQKQGMQLIGFWTPAEGPDVGRKLYYVLSHASKEAAEKSWKAFAADPEWQKAKTESEKDGPIVMKVERVWLSPTDYSALK